MKQKNEKRRKIDEEWKRKWVQEFVTVRAVTLLTKVADKKIGFLML